MYLFLYLLFAAWFAEFKVVDAKGTRIINRVNSMLSDSKLIVPPNSSTVCWTIYNPSPDPCELEAAR